MKKILFLIPALLYSIITLSQGITFETGTWEETLKKAQQTGKPVFVEFYKTGSDSCEHMTKNVYSLETVGKAYNEKFISFRMDIDKAEYAKLAKKLEISTLPSFVFFNPDGMPFCISNGATIPRKFIAISDQAMELKYNAETLNSLEKKYEAKKDDPVLLRSYIRKRSSLGLSNASLFDKYLELMPEDNRTSETVLDLYYLEGKNLRINTVAYNNLKKNAAKINESLGNVDYLLFSSVKNTVNDAALTKDEQTLTAAMSANDQLSDSAKIMQKEELYMLYYDMTKDPDNYMKYAAGYCKNYLMKISDAQIDKKNKESLQVVEDLIKAGSLPKANEALINKTRSEAAFAESNRIGNELNRLSMEAFDKTSDNKILKAALKWSKRAMEILPDKPQFIDTYAKLLYKLGKTKEALAMEEEATNKTPKEDLFRYRIEETVYKMKNNEKFWKR
jgi:thioredoxin-related protein